MLTVLDEHTRECHVLRADRALKSTAVIALVKEAITQHGASEFSPGSGQASPSFHQGWTKPTQPTNFTPSPSLTLLVARKGGFGQ